MRRARERVRVRSGGCVSFCVCLTGVSGPPVLTNVFPFVSPVRYLFFLQLKQDLLSGQLECPQETAVQLAALCVQCKYAETVYSDRYRVNMEPY